MFHRIAIQVLRWFDSGQQTDTPAGPGLQWLRLMPFILIHLACLAVWQVGWSPAALIVALALYLVRMFAITGFYHRYFSHRTFKTSRVCQFFFAVLGASSVQRGPLWWAAHHRHHHRHADEPEDVHSPVTGHFWRSHMLWFADEANFQTNHRRVKDLSRFPELRWLDRFDIAVPALLALALYLGGAWAQRTFPEWGTSGGQMLVWGFCISTVVLWHATFTINSLAHRFGSRRFETRDNSRNNPLLALLTLGEGWHNNHHRYPGAARQGFYWWELDLTYLGLRVMAMLGLIWDIRPVPRTLLAEKRG